MEEQYLSRKQRRKMERQAKKEKKNMFYMNKKSKKKIKMNKEEEDEIEEKVTKYPSKKDPIKQNKIKKVKDIIDESDSKDQIDKDIEYLEDKLGLADEKNLQKLNRTLTLENYDHDLLSFLDNIDTVVKKKDLSDYTKVKSKANKKDEEEEEIPSEIEEEIESDGDEEIEEEEEEEVPKKKPKSEKVVTKPIEKIQKVVQVDDKEQVQKFQKELTSLMNKIAESNISFLLPDVFTKIATFKRTNNNTFSLYDTITKISLKLLLNQEIINLPITSCICTFISLCHYKYGNNFIYFYLKELFDQIGQLTDETTPKYKIKNFIFEIIMFYIFNNITSKLIYDLIKFFIENFNENFSEYLLLLLSYTGIEIRKEDPENLKDIIVEINKKYNNLKVENSENVTKIQYIIDMIDDIRMNKYLKFNLSEKFSFFKNFITANTNNDVKKGDKIEIDIETIKKIDTKAICESEKDYLNDKDEDTKNKNKNAMLSLEDLENYIPDDLVDESTNQKLEKKMKKLKITTTLKKMIFNAIATSSDINDAFERLMRLNLKREQSREIIKMILLLCAEEKCYNPFYKILLERLMEVDKDHKYTYHYCIWDYMKIFENFKNKELKKIHNLSKLTAKLLVSEKISLPVLLHFKFEESDENTRMFVIFVLDFYFEESEEFKTKILFAKLVKNDDHVEFAQHLCQFLIKEFIKEIEITTKNEKYQENYAAAVKVLKKVL